MEIHETGNNAYDVEPILWNSPPVQENVTLTDYVNVDEDVAVWRALSDAKILN